MRAAVFMGPGKGLEIQHLPDLKPGPGELLLRVERCGICASDLHMTAAHEGPEDPNVITYPTGIILGHEIGAEVVEVGRDVERFKRGDFVVPMSTRGCGRCAECLAGRPIFCSQMTFNVGGYAEYMLSAATSSIPVRGGLSLADAALVEPLTVGLLGVSAAPVQPGDRVLVIGAGPIGLSAAYWAERMGAVGLAVAAPSRRRESIAMEMGATHFIAMDEGYEDQVYQALGGPPDVVLECVGAPGLIGKSVELVKVRGTVVVLGLCMHMEPFMPAPALFKEVRLQFAIATTTRQFEASIAALSAGSLSARAMVTDTISLDDLPAQFEALRHRSSQCKVLVAP